MTSQQLEILALAISEMNSATNPKSEAFAYKNPGKLHEVNGNLRNFSTWSGGLKSLISELSRFSDDVPLLKILQAYGASSIEREFLALDFLSQALGFIVGPTHTVGTLFSPKDI